MVIRSIYLLIFLLFTPLTTAANGRDLKEFIIHTPFELTTSELDLSRFGRLENAGIRFIYYAESYEDLSKILSFDCDMDITLTDLNRNSEFLRGTRSSHYAICIDHLSAKEKLSLSDRCRQLAATQLLAYFYLDTRKLTHPPSRHEIVSASSPPNISKHLNSMAPALATWLNKDQNDALLEKISTSYLLRNMIIFELLHEEENYGTKRSFFEGVNYALDSNIVAKNITDAIQDRWLAIIEKEFRPNQSLSPEAEKIVRDPRLFFLMSISDAFKQKVTAIFGKSRPVSIMLLLPKDNSPFTLTKEELANAMHKAHVDSYMNPIRQSNRRFTQAFMIVAPLAFCIGGYCGHLALKRNKNRQNNALEKN